MRIRAAVLLIVCSIAVASCAPSIKYQAMKTAFPSLPDTSRVVVYDVAERVPGDSVVLGQIRIGDTGLSINCGWDDILPEAQQKARAAGGNALQMLEISPPDGLSTCYRLVANVLRIEQASEEPAQPSTGTGTAFAVSRDGTLVTARHEVQDAVSMTTWLIDSPLCDTLRPGSMREAERFYRAGRPDSLRALAARWQAECAGTKAGQESRTLALMLAAADGRLEQQIDDVALFTLGGWRAAEPGASGAQRQPDSSDAEPDAMTTAAYRAFVADLASDLLARGGLDPQAEFVARWYATEDAQLEELQEKRYEGTALRKKFLAWRAEKTVVLFPGWIGGSFGTDFATLRCEGIWTTALRNENIVYEATYVRPVSFVFQRGHEVSEGSHPVIFTTTGPVTAALWGLAHLSTRLLVDPDLPVTLSPLRYFWFAPNSRFDFRLGRAHWLSLGTRTEFVLARGTDGERGILSSPRFAYIEGSDLPPREWNAYSLSVSIGPEYWWGFEEGSGWAGWSVEVQLQSFGS